MNSIRSLALVFTLIFATTANSTIIISEYIEGSSFNKAIEIYNFGEEVNFEFDQYAIEIYSNGSTAASFSINLSGVLMPNATFVVGHSKSDNEILAAANQLSGSLNFNGDDAVVLLHNGSVIDSIGQIGFDPGSQWGADETSTQNNSLQRLPDILSGDPNALDGFDPSVQWLGFTQDSFTNLGKHSINQGLSTATPFPAAEPAVSVPEPGIFWLMLAGMLGMYKSSRGNFPA